MQKEEPRGSGEVGGGGLGGGGLGSGSSAYSGLEIEKIEQLSDDGEDTQPCVRAA